MSERCLRQIIVAIGAACAGVTLIVTIHSLGWIGDPFPGFLIMKNRVVPSIALPMWPGTPSRLFQHEVVSMDGEPLTSAADAYAYVAARPPGTPIAWRFRAIDGSTIDATLATQRFGASDYLFLFGTYLFAGFVFAATALGVGYLKPRHSATRGILAGQLCMGLFPITGIDLYGPHYWFVPLHVATEVFLAAGLVHMGLVFPVDRMGRRRRLWLGSLYGPFALYYAVYLWRFDEPTAYTLLHLGASALQGVGAVVLLGANLWAFIASDSPLVRRRIGVVSLGAAGGFLVPAILVGSAGLVGGRVPVNIAAFPAVLFPLAVGYAAMQRDLFEIDVFIRRALTYALVLAGVGATYLILLTIAGGLLPHDFVQSPLALAGLNVLLLFALAPIQQRVQSAVDRVFFRKGYDAEAALGELGQALASAHVLHEVLSVTHRVVVTALAPESWGIYLVTAGGTLRHAGGSAGPVEIVLPEDMSARAAAGDILTRYEWQDDERPLPAVWQQLGADLLVPIRSWGPPIALLVLSRRGSGHHYGIQDGAFLRAAAGQIALALTNARAFAQLEELNATLERQVRERTAALETANAELSVSVGEQRRAYQQLERSQTSLVRAERLATLGRLAAGVAHEMNTPLAAVQNSLKVLTDLGTEYGSSVDDPNVSPEDHKQIAAEIVEVAGAAAGWAGKAATFIAKVKLHAREQSLGALRKFPISDVVDEVQALLAHRVRAGGFDVIAEVVPDLQLVGEPGRLGQVLVNVVGNAMDAYEDRGSRGGPIEIRAVRDGQMAVVTVRDWAGGIPPEVLSRIFDELYTTKEPGRGTGLGLWITKTLVEEQFGGSIVVETEPPVGSCFRLTLPLAPAEAAGAAADRPAAQAGGAWRPSHKPASITNVDEAAPRQLR
jgi:signal transduction histidine kinase